MNHEINAEKDISVEYIPPSKENWGRLNSMMVEIDTALKKHKIFQVLDTQNAVEFFKGFTDMDGTIMNSENWELYYKTASLYKPMIDDIFNFNKTMYYFVNDFLSHLKKLDPENFAAAYYDFLTNPMAYKMTANPIMNEYMSYTSADFLEMNMIPKEITDGCGEYVIAEYYHVERLQSFLKVDFLKGLMAGHHIRRCKHCGRFFLMTKGYKTRYCDKPAPENPRFTCNQMAYRTVRIKEENADNPKYQSYRRCLNRVMRSYQRKVIDGKQKSVLLRQAEELYHRAMTSPEFSNEEFEQQMQSENLYKLCGFDVPKRGRPKAVKNDK
ncbi:DUF6076 domain-containing protein [Ruminococcus sp.]|nr:hypothetical protein [Ruminococcus bicirculans (ex Wegman et al. 2014)]MCT6521075.1 DUF6076 domain-containing protein [Ruminococcus bicirculans (ex Wegman et al. 2014)]